MFSFGGVFGHDVRPNILRNSGLVPYALVFRLRLCSEERLREAAIFCAVEKNVSLQIQCVLLCRIAWADQERRLQIHRCWTGKIDAVEALFFVELKQNGTYSYAARCR